MGKGANGTEALRPRKLPYSDCEITRKFKGACAGIYVVTASHIGPQIFDSMSSFSIDSGTVDLFPPSKRTLMRAEAWQLAKRCRSPLPAVSNQVEGA